MRLRQFIFTAGLYSLIPILQRGIGFLTIPIMTSVLSPADYGITLLLGNALNVITFVLNVGLDSAFMVHYCAAKTELEKRRIFGVVLAIRLLSYIPLLIVTIIMAEEVRRLLIPQYQDAWVLVLALGGLTLEVVVQHYAILLRALELHKRRVASDLARSVVQPLVTIILVLTTALGIQSIYIGNIVAAACILPFYVFWMWDKAGLSMHRTTLRHLLRYGLPLLPSGLSTMAILNFVGFILERFVSIEEVGLFAVATSIASLIAVMTLGFQQVWAPFVYNNYHEEGSQDLFVRIHRIYASFLLLAAAGLSLVSPELVKLVTANDFHEAWRFVPPAVMMLSVYSMSDYFNIGIGIKKKSEYRLIASLFAAISFAAIVVPLVTTFGPIGMSLAQTTAFLLFGIILGHYSRRLFACPFQWKRVISIWAIGVTVIGVIMYGTSNEPSIWLRLFAFFMLPGVLLATRTVQFEELVMLKNQVLMRPSAYSHGNSQ